MEKSFNTVLRVLAGICAVLFVVTTVTALLAFNGERRLFDAQSYLEAFEEQHLYDQIPALAADTLKSMSRGGQSDMGFTVPDSMAFLSAKDWQAIIGAVLPPEVTRALVEDSVTSAFDYLNGKTESATLSLAALKSHLSGRGAVESVMQLLRSQPPCTMEDLAQMALSGWFGEPELVLCNPSNEILNIVPPLIQDEFQAIAADIPETVTLIPANATTARNLVTVVRIVRILVWVGLLLPPVLLLLIVVFAVRSWRGWLYWWGIPVFASGALGLALAAIVRPVFQWAFGIFLAPRFPTSLPASVLDACRNVLGAVISKVTIPVIIQSIVLLLAGAALILAAQIKIPAKPKPLPYRTEGGFPTRP
jgi:hypothetical protein